MGSSSSNGGWFDTVAKSISFKGKAFLLESSQGFHGGRGGTRFHSNGASTNARTRGCISCEAGLYYFWEMCVYECFTCS